MSLSSSYRCQLDWGRDGTRRAVERGDVLVIVDVLSFSTAVATAVHNGGIIYPCSQNEDASAIAQHIGGEVAVHRRNVPQKGRFSLSPVTYRNIEPGTKVVLASPNGATCSRYASQVPYLFVGALVNAQAVALAVSQVLEKEALNVTMIACGERWYKRYFDSAAWPTGAIIVAVGNCSNHCNAGTAYSRNRASSQRFAAAATSD